MLTEHELKLLEIAEQIIEDNQHIGARLGGSLMLRLRGYTLRRPVGDIDIICDSISDDEEEYMPKLHPLGFTETIYKEQKRFFDLLLNTSISASAIKQYTCNTTNIKIDFLPGEDSSEIILGVPCGNAEETIYAKLAYIRQSTIKKTCDKHRLDLLFLREQLPYNIAQLNNLI